ncbi:ATP-binding protein, partial [Nocardia cyriacigeorgica]|uniref:ATP-binding protein n=1 Tax=Nocardia cyriacigeorgica TaxID=135487 RepID=UPI002455DA9D
MTATDTHLLRPHAEQAYADELRALAAVDDRPRPPSWRLSPWAVVTYLLGGTLDDGTVISPKYVGPRRLMEVAVATLATDRALLLLGVPGTAKTWVSEHLSAAISGASTLLVQGTSGTGEEAIRYGWNYARLLAEGPSDGALVPSPVLTAMRTGAIARIEELTRIPSDVQDALITVLSEKTLPIPELGAEVQAAKGFNVIATANDRDRGVNELSSALRRRFNTVVLPLPASEEDEVAIVTRRVAQLGSALELPEVPAAAEEVRRVVRIFRELREGVTADGRTKLKSPSGTLSTAEAISAITNGLALSAHFGDGVLRAGGVGRAGGGWVLKVAVGGAGVWAENMVGGGREPPEGGG